MWRFTPAPKPLPVAPALTIDPRAHDYGTIRKGTRAVRQFEVMNHGDQPVTIDVERFVLAHKTCRPDRAEPHRRLADVPVQRQ